MDHKQAAIELAKLIEQKAITVTMNAITERPDGFWSEKPYTSTHYKFTVSNKRTSYEGFYSKGCADVLAAFKKGYKSPKTGTRRTLEFYNWPDKGTLIRVLTGKARPYDADIPKFQEAMREIGAKLLPSATDILSSMLTDSAGADQPFPDWADDLGYDSDSIKAKTVWETCNAERWALQGLFGTDFELAQSLALDM